MFILRQKVETQKETFLQESRVERKLTQQQTRNILNQGKDFFHYKEDGRELGGMVKFYFYLFKLMVKV